MNDTTRLEVGQARPPRIDAPHRNLVIRSVNGTAILNDAQKRLWLGMLHLDQKKPDGSEPGCYASVEILAQRMCWKVQKAERVRTQLKNKGFLVSANRPGYLNDTWYPILPIPLPETSTLSPSLEQTMAFTKQLDQAKPTPSRGGLIANPTTFPGSDQPPLEGVPLKRTEYRNEPRNEPTTSTQEEEVVGREEKIRRDFREVMHRDPTPSEMRVCGQQPTGTDG